MQAIAEFLISKLREIFVYDPASPLIFNSGIFLILFVAFIIGYALIHKNRPVVIIFVTIFSLFFYYKSSGLFLWILIFTSVTDYSFAMFVFKAKKTSWKKLWLFLAISTSLAILAFFKYTNFFLENLVAFSKYLGDYQWFASMVDGVEIPHYKSFAEIMTSNFQPLDIFLPIGISFYTFQSISYVIDVYQKKIEPTTNIIDYAFFLSFFPQLVAGPIVKANHFLPQLKSKITLNKDAIWVGFWLIIVGLFKKAVIADYISQYNDYIFAAPHTYSGFENLMAILGYALQIYCDFSGYSDMAIGLAMIMGFDLGINFNFPYKALNITDFWRRWHISLSSWLRDYVYITFGGNKKGKWKMYRNLFITMFLGGLWHGANWKFVVWGAMHGIGLAVHKAFSVILKKIPNVFPVRFLSWALTFIFVITLWIFFRATDVAETTITKTVKNAANYESVSKTIAETDTSKTVTVLFTENGTLKDSITETLYFKLGDKILLSEKAKDKDKEISIKLMIGAYNVSFIMIKQVLFETDIMLYAVPFFQAHTLWIVLMVVGFLMHANPLKWTHKITNLFSKSPLVVKLFIFIIVVQLVIQLKSEDVVPFIYFQF